MRHRLGWTGALVGLVGLAAGVVAQDPQKKALQQKLKDTDLVGAWIYDDVNAGYAEARKKSKPMLVVFR